MTLTIKEGGYYRDREGHEAEVERTPWLLRAFGKAPYRRMINMIGGLGYFDFEWEYLSAAEADALAAERATRLAGREG